MSIGHGESPITIELPQEALAPIAPTAEAFAKEMRLAAAIEWYRQGRISQGRGAEIAGLNRIEFLEALCRTEVSPSPLTPDELREEADRTIVAGTEMEQPGETREVPSTVSQEPHVGATFTPAAAEGHYRPLGRLKGEMSTDNVQTSARAFWQSSGVEGARWLARRLRWEVQIETLHAAAALLADLGCAAVTPIAEELARNPTSDQAWALLQALGWLANGPSAQTIEEASVELLLASFLQHRDPDVREAAAHAMRLLPPEQAVYWLRRREREEQDREVVLTIEDELTHYPAASG
jgi:predicted HTH domain antitoxin